MRKEKKSSEKHIKHLLHADTGDSSHGASQDEMSRTIGGLSKSQVAELLKMNPGLAQQLNITSEDLSTQQAIDTLKGLSLEDIMMGLAANGKNAKDISSYKFWQTQPVPKFGEGKQIEDGPFQTMAIEDVPKQPVPLIDGFEWVTMDLTNDEVLQEVFDLLSGHYVEDNEAMFRLNYPKPFLRW